MKRILIIDDDKALCRSMEIQLTAEGFDVQCAHSGDDGMVGIDRWHPDLLFLDLMLPDQTGLDVLNRLGEKTQDLSVVMITGTQDTQNVITAMKLGAFDYIRKPLNIDDIFLVVEKVRSFHGTRGARHTSAADRKMDEVTETATMPISSSALTSNEPDHRKIIGENELILELLKQIGILSISDVTVLIEGESGTGKELVARALHNASRPRQPFMAINCSSIVSTLPESELFGHEKGAFTGADRRKVGKFEFAGEGTVFLDEIGDLALDLQAKLLRVIQECEFERVGGLEMIPLRARVVAATNRDLSAMVLAGQFRKDLYYRLAVSRLHIPPLRSRRDDIPLLAKHLIHQIAGHIHKRPPLIGEAALKALQTYEWPGNIRELENVLTRAILLSRGGDLSETAISFALGTGTAGSEQTAENEREAGNQPASTRLEIMPLRDAEKRYIRSVLIALDWNITRTAKRLDISPTTLRKKIADYNLHP